MQKYLFPLIIGIGGIIVLMQLGLWQLDRLEWKEGILDEIQTRQDLQPVPLLAAPNEADNEYQSFLVSGKATGQELHVLVSGTQAGTGYRVVSAFETDDGRRIMVDQGLLDIADKALLPDPQPVHIQGTLLWPDDLTSATPDPDIEGNIWFARDVPAMAQVLGTEEILLVLEYADQYDTRLTPLPIDTIGIKNDHLEYAITWFLLAVVWGSMALYMIIRITRRKDVH